MKTSLLSLSLIAISVLTGCGRHSEATSNAPTTLPSAKVRLVTARFESVPALTEVTGIVRPAQHALLAAKVMGTIDEIPVTLGQRIRAGDLLVKISAAEISARVTQAESQFNAARRDLERERDLLIKGASTADMVKGLEDRFAVVQAMVREAETMLGYATVRAPFDGVVARKMANVGDLASPGLPLLEVEGTTTFQIETEVPDSAASLLQAGHTVTARLSPTDATFSATIAEISSAADPSAHTVLAKISIPSETAARSGAFARVQIPGEPVTTLMVPTTALSTLGQMERVFVAGPDQRAVLRLVKSGAARGDHVEILAGLENGERVVLAPPANLREGQPLEAMP